MPHDSSVFATPDDDIVMLAGTSLSWLAGTDSTFPASRAKDAAPGSVTKNTGLTGTLRSTHASVSLVGAAAFWTNATAITLSDSGGSIGNMNPLARDGDNHPNNPFTSFNARTSTTFDMAMVKTGGSVPLWVGEIRLIKAWREMHLRYPLKKRLVEYGPPDQRTFLGTPLEWPQDIRGYVWEGECNRHDELGKLVDLYARSRILRRPFVFVEFWNTNKAYLVRFSESTLEMSRNEDSSTVVQIKLEEVPAGTPPPSA